MRKFLLAALLLTGCSPKTIEGLPTPPERLVCEAAGDRPAIPAEMVIDWAGVVTVEQARAAHDAYVRRIHDRDQVVAGYLVSLEGKHFTCWLNAKWRREFEAGWTAGRR